MIHSFKGRSLVSISDLGQEEIVFLLKKARMMKQHPPKELLRGKILASCFFEPSTRTRLSFEAAMLRLGGQHMGFSLSASTSTTKGESLQDTIKVIGNYADVIVLRHPAEGAARAASQATSTPIINAGDGANQHPTQTLLDLFTIQECQKKLKGLSIAFVGDLKFGRTVHSLSQACTHFDCTLFFVSPDSLTLPEEVLHFLKRKGVKFSFHCSIEEVIERIDILYMTRIQQERFDPLSYEKVKNTFRLKKEMLYKARKNLKVLHPLPRVNEIDPAIDTTPYAYYFQQAENGLYMRMALLTTILA